MGWNTFQKISHLGIPHWCCETQRRLTIKNKWRQNESVRDGGKEGERERERGGWWDTEGVEGRDQAGRRERTDSGGTMTWKSRAGDHTLHWHIWGGTKYPDLFTHTHTRTYMYACKHTHLQMHKKTKTHTQWETANAAGGCTTKRSQLRAEHLNTAIITALPTLTDL